MQGGGGHSGDECKEGGGHSGDESESVQVQVHGGGGERERGVRSTRL